MKNLLFIALFLFSIKGITQESNTKKNELGINVFSIVDGNGFEPLRGNNIDYFMSIQFATGVMYKHHWNKSAIRVGLDYYYETENLKFPDTESSFLKIVNRTGYQYTFGNGKLKPFVAIDAVFGVIRRYSKWHNWDVISFPETVETTGITYELGIAPTIGLQYQITPRFSATIEASGEAGGSIYRQSDKLKGGREFFYLNPIRLLSVNYHF